MTGQPGRFPEGEPSVKSVTAALARAQEVAMARAAALQDAKVSQDSAEEATTAATHIDLASATSGAVGRVADD